MGRKKSEPKTEENQVQEDFAVHNATLAELSRQVFGDGMQLMAVDPSSLMLLKDNARFFKRETFRQLRDNIAADKRLSSVPLCYRHDDGKLEVLSGNHRVKASIEAGLQRIIVLVITEELEKSKRIAIQLSHNALAGEDDQSILANLWTQIESVADKLYSGLDSEIVKELGDVELVNFSTPQVPAHMVTFMFTDGEKDQLYGEVELFLVRPGLDAPDFLLLPAALPVRSLFSHNVRCAGHRQAGHVAFHIAQPKRAVLLLFQAAPANVVIELGLAELAPVFADMSQDSPPVRKAGFGLDGIFQHPACAFQSGKIGLGRIVQGGPLGTFLRA